MKAERGAQEGAGEAWFGVQSFENLSRSPRPYTIIGSYEHVSVDDQGGVSWSLGNHSRGLFLYPRLEGDVLLTHVVPVNLDPLLLEKLIHDISKIDNFEWDLSLLGHRI